LENLSASTVPQSKENIFRLNMFNNVFEELICESEIFGEILRKIKVKIYSIDYSQETKLTIDSKWHSAKANFVYLS
jgi:hypothetical protein